MDFYIDIGFAVLLRILKDKRQYAKYEAAFKKVFIAIARAFSSKSVEWMQEAIE